jgi:uncharacterized protein with PQ loop repeat
VAGIALVAGSVATAIFMLSQLPMLIKAGRTKDLASYSPLNIVLSNVGNLIYAVYVFNLPPGPIWAMHMFYLTATGLMLFWYLRHRTGRSHGMQSSTVARSSSRIDAHEHASSQVSCASMINQPPEPRVLKEVAYVCQVRVGWPTMNGLPLWPTEDGARLDNAPCLALGVAGDEVHVVAGVLEDHPFPRSRRVGSASTEADGATLATSGGR